MKSTKSKIKKINNKVKANGRTWSREAFENYRKYQAKYIKSHYDPISFSLLKNQDRKIIEYLDKKENLTGYLRGLIEREIKKGGDIAND